MSAKKRDLYAEVTAKLIAAIEANPGEFRMPWHRNTGGNMWLPTNAATKKRYSGVNVIALWNSAEKQNFTAPLWATYNQWLDLGAQVRKGETATAIVKYGEFTVEPTTATDNGRRLYLKGFSVFNVSQVDGYVMPSAPAPLPAVERIAAAEAFVANTKADIRYGGDRAYYRPSTDQIQMPDDTRWTGTDTTSAAEAHASTKLHELIHWTSHAKRLDRTLGKRFGDAAYCAEELIAEIGAAMLCAELGVSSEPRLDHAQYLAHFLALMKADSKAIFTAASAASKAADYLRGLQPVTETTESEGE